jgi:hypothetical protein
VPGQRERASDPNDRRDRRNSVVFILTLIIGLPAAIASCFVIADHLESGTAPATTRPSGDEDRSGISGTIRSEAGAPLAGFQVEASADGFKPKTSNTTGTDGKYHLPLGQGDYYLLAFDTDPRAQAPPQRYRQQLTIASNVGSTVHVSKDATSQANFIMHTRRCASLRMTVISMATGQPIEGAFLTPYDAVIDGRPLVWSAEQTSAAGVSNAYCWPSGSFRLQVSWTDGAGNHQTTYRDPDTGSALVRAKAGRVTRLTIVAG